MLDIQFIRENADKVKQGVAAKQLDPAVVDKVLELDEKRRELVQHTDQVRAKRNDNAQVLKKAAQDKKKPDPVLIDEGKRIKEELKNLEPQLAQAEEEYLKVLRQIPNVPAEDVKLGKNESENQILRSWGEIPEFDFEVKDHLTIGEELGIIDVTRASKVSGPRFYYLKGDAVLLEWALIQLAREMLTKEGFIPVLPPVFIKTEMMAGMGYMEHGGDEDMYVFEKDGLVLVATSEQSIGTMHAGEVLNLKNGPIRYMGFSSCFRREAGSYGQDTRGMLRVHQFDKVEMFSFTRPQDSDKEHEFLLGMEEKLLQSLQIPYQVVKMCTGDLGLPFIRKYDLEGWFASQSKYRELTSTSNATDYQARRLNIRHREADKTEYVHMLNGTAFSSRPIAVILENYQQKDGSVVVPEVLRKWMGKDKITK